MARPSDPAAYKKSANKSKTWDVWYTEYNPRFGDHVFRDGPFNDGKDPFGQGKDLCPSPKDARATSVTDLFPHCSWLT